MAITRSCVAQFIAPKKGRAVVWFYRNQASLSIYVRPLDKDGREMVREPISFRILLNAKPAAAASPISVQTQRLEFPGSAT